MSFEIKEGRKEEWKERKEEGRKGKWKKGRKHRRKVLKTWRIFEQKSVSKELGVKIHICTVLENVINKMINLKN